MAHSRIRLGAALACGALALWGCSGENLGGSGAGGRSAGGTIGTGGSLNGTGGSLNGTGGSLGVGGDRPGGFGGDGIGTGGFSGSGGVTSSGGIGDGGGGVTGAGGDCQVEAPIPPVLVVVDATTGSPICDPTFAVVVASGGAIIPTPTGNPVLCEGTFPWGCPAPPDAGPPPCQFVLTALDQQGTLYTVDVSAPRYLTSQVAVTGGFQGCTMTTPASISQLDLFPGPADAGTTTDAHF